MNDKLPVAMPENGHVSKRLDVQASEILNNTLADIKARTLKAGKKMVGILDLNTRIELFHGRIFAAAKIMSGIPGNLD
jgi:hypothetical protein